jgi:hypothetical protein
LAITGHTVGWALPTNSLEIQKLLAEDVLLIRIQMAFLVAAWFSLRRHRRDACATGKIFHFIATQY